MPSEPGWRFDWYYHREKLTFRPRGDNDEVTWTNVPFFSGDDSLCCTFGEREVLVDTVDLSPESVKSILDMRGALPPLQCLHQLGWSLQPAVFILEHEFGAS